MTNREKVIKGLELCRKFTNSCEECPYESMLPAEKCMFVMHNDAFALLKEQEEQIKKFELERSWDENPDMMGKW